MIFSDKLLILTLLIEFCFFGQINSTRFNPECQIKSKFLHIIGSKNEDYYNLGYYFAQLFTEIKFAHPTTTASKRNLLRLTTDLINTMNPYNLYDIEYKSNALNEFKDCIGIGGYNDTLRQLAATIIGLVSGILLGIIFAIGGFLAGLSRFETLGLASIPCTFIGAYNGAKTGFDWGHETILGHKNARSIIKTIYKLNQEYSKADSNTTSNAFNSNYDVDYNENMFDVCDY